MTRADQIALALNQKRMDFSELLEEAYKTSDTCDQDWDNETTTFNFCDGSVAVFCGVDQSISSY